MGGRALAPIAIRTSRPFYDYHAKYESAETRYLLPSGLPGPVELRLQSLALQAFAEIGGRDWGRVDFLVDASGQPYLLEINSVPGMTSHSLVPMAARAAGQDLADLCLNILHATQGRRRHG